MLLAQSNYLYYLCVINKKIEIMSELKQMQELLLMSDVISRLKIDLDRWIDGCEKTSGNLSDIGHTKEAENFNGQATAYWAIKNYLEVNGL